MKIIIPGGSGQLGIILSRAFWSAGHTVIVLSRNPTAAPWRILPWNAKSLGPWADEMNGADLVINLAGRSVNCRYTHANRHAIRQSRIDSTRVVGHAIASAYNPPRLWLQSSTATIYSHRFDAPNDDLTGILGGNEPNAPDTWRFSIDVAKSWEQAALDSNTPNTRKVLLRSAMVMSPDRAGVFDTLLNLTRHGLGGRAGNGRQYVSWIHDQDFIRAIHWLIDHDLSGPVNLASPHPLPNSDFMRAIRHAAHIPLGLPAARWMLEIGALFLATETELILKSRRVIPTRLVQAGFTFQFPHWPPAAANLYQRWAQMYAAPRK